MNSNKSNPVFDVTMRILSAISLLGTLVIVLINHFVERKGPEINRHEILVIYILLTQLAFFAFSAICGAILAGFRGGLSLSHFSACLIVAAICAFIAVYFYIAVSS
jgi:hypothetical protein